MVMLLVSVCVLEYVSVCCYRCVSDGSQSDGLTCHCGIVQGHSSTPNTQSAASPLYDSGPRIQLNSPETASASTEWNIRPDNPIKWCRWPRRC